MGKAYPAAADDVSWEISCRLPHSGYDSAIAGLKGRAYQKLSQMHHLVTLIIFTFLKIQVGWRHFSWSCRKLLLLHKLSRWCGSCYYCSNLEKIIISTKLRATPSNGRGKRFVFFFFFFCEKPNIRFKFLFTVFCFHVQLRVSKMHVSKKFWKIEGKIF